MVSAAGARDRGIPDRPLIYVSYSRRDRKLVEEMLAVVRTSLPDAEVFYDVLIRAGEDFSDTLARRLDEAPVVLFCLSPDWLNSSNCRQELQAALAHPDKRLIPIILKPCDWFSTPLARFMALPRDTKPVSTWKSRDEAFADIAHGISAVLAPIETRRADAAAALPARHTAPVRRIVVNPEATRAISASDDGSTIVWDLATMHSTATLKHDGPVTDLAIGADGRTVVTCSGNTLSAWDITSGAVQWSLHSEEAIVGVALHRDDVIAITGTGAALLARLGEQAPSARVVAEGQSSSFTAVTVSADGRAWVAGLNDGACQMFDASRRLATRAVGSGPIVAIHPLVDGVHYVCGSTDGFIRIFSFEGEQREFVVAPPVSGLSPMAGGTHAAVAAGTSVKIIDLTTGALLQDWDLVEDPPTAVATTRDGRRIVWGTRSGAVSVRPVGTTTQLSLPTGEDRLRLAYLAVLELPELWNVLESLDESALAGVGAQLQLGPDQNVLQALQNRRPGVEPPPLWTAWIASLYPGKVDSPHGAR